MVDAKLSGTFVARINSRLLDQFKGQTVRLTAKVIKLSGDTATVEASDGGQVCLSSPLLSSIFPALPHLLLRPHPGSHPYRWLTASKV